MRWPLASGFAAAVLVTAAAAAGGAPARQPRPVISLSVTPAHVTLLARHAQKLAIVNDGARRARVLVRPASFALDLYGNAIVAPRPAPRRSARMWLVVRPRRLAIKPRRTRILRISARPPRHAAAGDHPALVLLSTPASTRAGVSIRTRLGVLVFVRVPGRLVRRLVIGGVSAGPGRSILVTVINRGNLAERLLPGQLTVSALAGRRVVALARGRARDFLPHARGLVLVLLPRHLRGRFTVVVRIAAEPGWTAGPSAPPLRGARRAVSLGL